MSKRKGITRRDLLKGAAVGTVLAAAGTTGLQRFGFLGAPGTVTGALAQGVQIPLAGGAIPQFVDPLPLLSVAGGPMETIIAGAGEIELHMREFQASVMPSTFVPAIGTYTGTWVFGYIVGGGVPAGPLGTYLGPVIIATRYQPTQIRFVNNLTTNNIAWREWTDQTLHWADPLNPPPNDNMCAHMGGMPMGECAQHYQLCLTCTAGRSRRCWTAGRMPGSPATAPTRATGTTHTPGSPPPATSVSTAIRTPWNRR
jgi:hypothetical protein